MTCAPNPLEPNQSLRPVKAVRQACMCRYLQLNYCPFEPTCQLCSALTVLPCHYCKTLSCYVNCSRMAIIVTNPDPAVEARQLKPVVHSTWPYHQPTSELLRSCSHNPSTHQDQLDALRGTTPRWCTTALCSSCNCVSRKPGGRHPSSRGLRQLTALQKRNAAKGLRRILAVSLGLACLIFSLHGDYGKPYWGPVVFAPWVQWIWRRRIKPKLEAMLLSLDCMLLYLEDIEMSSLQDQSHFVNGWSS